MKMLNWFFAKDHSISNRIIIPLNVVSAICLILFGLGLVLQQRTQLRGLGLSKIDSISIFMERASAVYIQNWDLTALDGFSSEAVKVEMIDYAYFLDSNDKFLTGFSRKERIDPKTALNELSALWGSQEMVREIKTDGKSLGFLKVGYNFKTINSKVFQSIILISIAITFVQLLLSMLILFIVRSLAQPLEAVRAQVTATTASSERVSLTLKAQAAELSSASTQQAASVQESVAAMTEMSNMIQQTGRHVVEIETVSEHVRGKTAEGSQIMGEMASSMESIEESHRGLEGLVAIINEIRDKTKIINDIVFKTQLLSFNASIEAARAGQHGRGFAVVAEEVGKLAHTSGAAAGEIESLLTNSQRQVDSLVSDVKKRITVGKSVSALALTRFQEISKEIVSMSDKISQIGGATKEQENAVNETSRTMGELDSTAQRNNLAAQKMTQMADNAREQGEQLRSVSKGIQILVLGARAAAVAAAGAEASSHANQMDQLPILSPSQTDHQEYKFRRRA